MTIRQAESDGDIAACMALRWRVFVEEQGVPEADELDGTEDGSVHLMAERDGVLLGVARYHLTGDSVKISRVCVTPEARGNGLGAALIRHVLETVPARTARLSAQTDAVAFYEALGFTARGAAYLDAGIPHRDMERVS